MSSVVSVTRKNYNYHGGCANWQRGLYTHSSVANYWSFFNNNLFLLLLPLEYEKIDFLYVLINYPLFFIRMFSRILPLVYLIMKRK